MSGQYEAVIGLEVHCQLQTRSKLFTAAPASYTDEPNTHIDAITLGHPGTLPVANRTAVEYIVRLGLASNCSIRSLSHFARKHYFYPDLPKGYQISQYEDPICHDGHLIVTWEEGGESREGKVRITRIHLEEDAGKSIHDRDPARTFLDYNRAGVPLAEIVTEPDIRSPRQAYEYMRQIRQLVRYLGICDGNMEEGSLRCDANVSVRPTGTTPLGVKTEIKNMNSFRHVESALAFEIERQKKVLQEGGSVVQETLLWDVERQVTKSMRSKEEAHDYRYFEDPDLCPIVVSKDWLDSIRESIPRLAQERVRSYVEDLELSSYDAGVLTEEREISDYFESVIDVLTDGEKYASGEAVKQAANYVMTDVLRVLKEDQVEIETFPVTPSQLASLVSLRLAGNVSSSAAQEIFDVMSRSSQTAEEIAAEKNLITVTDDSKLLPVVRQVVESHPKQVAAYRGGKDSLMGFFIGQVMRNFEGSPDPKSVRELLQKELGSDS